MVPFNLVTVGLLTDLVVVCLGRGVSYNYGNGSYYEGFVDGWGRPSGHGKFYSDQGDLTYNGSFSGGLFNGTGEWFSTNGHKYQGEFLDGAASGLGTWFTPTGDTIYGEFRDHKLHGDATWSFKHSRTLLKMIGQFRYGYANGTGTVFFTDGSRLKTRFQKGYPHGIGQLFDGSDQLVWEGLYLCGRPNGVVPEDVFQLIYFKNPLRLNYKVQRKNL